MKAAWDANRKCKLGAPRLDSLAPFPILTAAAGISGVGPRRPATTSEP